VNAIGAQTAAQRIELLIVDQFASAYPRLNPPPNLLSRHIEVPPHSEWGETEPSRSRSACLRRGVYRRSFGAGSQLGRRNPARVLRRLGCGGLHISKCKPRHLYLAIGFLADYLLWAVPLPPAPVRHLRATTSPIGAGAACVGESLGRLLNSDFLAQENLKRQGLSWHDPRGDCSARKSASRSPALAAISSTAVIGAGRVESGDWGWAKRVAYGLAVPVITPWIKLGRVFRVQVRRLVCGRMHRGHPDIPRVGCGRR